MKPLALAGIVLSVLGGFIVFRGLSYRAQRSVVNVGDLRVIATEQRVIPVWVGVGAIVGGLLLLGAGLQRRRA